MAIEVANEYPTRPAKTRRRRRECRWPTVVAVALSDGWLSLDHFAAKFIHGRQLLSAEAVRLTTADAGTPGPCGIGWWNNGEGDCAKLPRDAFFGSGAGPKFKT